MSTRIISSTWNSYGNDQEELEYYLSIMTSPYIIAEKFITAKIIFEQLIKLEATRLIPEEDRDPITTEIIGTNDPDLIDNIKGYLNGLGADYRIENDFVFHTESVNYDNNGSLEVVDDPLIVKYMFILQSTKHIKHEETIYTPSGEPHRSYNGSPIKDVAYHAKSGDNIGGRIPYLYDTDISPENLNYPTQSAHIALDDIPANKAAAIILEVIALTFDDDFYAEIRDDYTQRASSFSPIKKMDTPKQTHATPYAKQTTKGFPWGWVIAAGFVALILFNL